MEAGIENELINIFWSEMFKYVVFFDVFVLFLPLDSGFWLEIITTVLGAIYKNPE